MTMRQFAAKTSTKKHHCPLSPPVAAAKHINLQLFSLDDLSNSPVVFDIHSTPKPKPAVVQPPNYATLHQKFLQNSKWVESNPLHGYRIATSDLYGMALLGTKRLKELSIRNGPTPEVAIGRVLHKNKLSQVNQKVESSNISAENMDKAILGWMTARSTKCWNVLMAESIALLDRIEPSDILKANMINDLIKWRRFIAALGRNPSQFNLIHSLGPHLAAVYSELCGTRAADCEALTALNNLVINLARYNRAPGQALCNLGLYLSCRVMSPPSIFLFLKLGLQNGYFGPDTSRPSLDSLSTEKQRNSPTEQLPPRSKDHMLDLHVNPKHRHVSCKWQTSCDTLANGLGLIFHFLCYPSEYPIDRDSSWMIFYRLLSLMTGYSLAKTTLEPGFRAAIEGSSEYFGAYIYYILILGRLGGFRLLWHEYHSSMGFPCPQPPSFGTEQRTPETTEVTAAHLKRKLFAIAVTATVSSPARAFSGQGFTKHDSSELRADYALDCRRHLRTLLREKRDFGWGNSDPATDRDRLNSWASGGAMELLEASKISSSVVDNVTRALEAPYQQAMENLDHVISTTISR